MNFNYGGTLRYYCTDPDYPAAIIPSAEPKRIDLTEELLSIFCRKNPDGTKHLALPGNYLYTQIDRRLEDIDYPIIAKFLQNHKEVHSVELAYNRIKIDELCDLLLALETSNVEYLSLMNCDLGLNQLACIADILKDTKITSLRINNNKFGRKGGDLIEEVIRNSHLKFLDVGGISADWGLLGFIANAIRDPCVFLEVLDVSRIIPNSILSLENSEFVAEMLEIIIDKANCLKELHVRHNSLTGHDIEYIARGVKRSKTLLFLDLAGNRIGDLGAEYLAEALRTRPMLSGLNLCACDIGDIGARALGHAIPFSKLRLLDVSYNRMCYGGLRILFHTMKKPQKLRVLSIWGNRFDNMTNKIVYRMYNSGVLEEESLDVRPIYEDGVYRILKMTNAAHMHRHRYYLVRWPPVNPMAPIPNVTKEKLKLDFEHVKKIKASESVKMSKEVKQVLLPSTPRYESTSALGSQPLKQMESTLQSLYDQDEEGTESDELRCLCRHQKIKYYEDSQQEQIVESTSSSSSSAMTTDKSDALEEEFGEKLTPICKCASTHEHTCKMVKKIHIVEEVTIAESKYDYVHTKQSAIDRENQTIPAEPKLNVFQKFI